jgi:1-deoxy-D-xylulose-5-phosphate synthase
VAITAAIADGTGLTPFAEEFPRRFFDVGIAEAHAVTFAAGLAAAGLRPVAAIYSSFAQRAYDSIVHDVCIQKLPVILALDRAGLVGEDGRTHHGTFDLAYLRSLPSIVVMAPRDEAELRRMLRTAFTIDGPVAIRYPRGSGLGVPLDGGPAYVQVGRAETLREGCDLALVGVGSAVRPALAAAELLAARGVDAAVVDARFVKPLDDETILRVARATGRVVTVEEHALAGGFGSAVAELLADRGVSQAVALRRIGLPDTFVEHGPQGLLRELYGLTPEGIVRAVEVEFPELAQGALTTGVMRNP